MQIKKLVAYVAVGVSLLAVGLPAVLLAHSQHAEPSSDKPALAAQVAKLQQIPTVTAAIKAPKLSEPDWLQKQNAAERAAAQRTSPQSASSRVVTYDIMTRGVITANLAEFKLLANATLNDGRGWARLGVSFKEVASGGMFTLVLSEAAQVPSFSPSGCGAEYSCRVGRYVIINQDRWLGATPSWNNAGGSLRDYRHMVVNHETGHWLGHGHATVCGTEGLAQVMQQQSINLRGCAFNPWPVATELWSSQLGVSL